MRNIGKASLSLPLKCSNYIQLVPNNLFFLFVFLFAQQQQQQQQQQCVKHTSVHIQINILQHLVGAERASEPEVTVALYVVLHISKKQTYEDELFIYLSNS